MRHAVVGVLFLGFVTILPIQPVLHAQQVERVYPDYNHSALMGVAAVENGDIYVAGSNNSLLRSTDGGSSWVQMPMDGYHLHIHKLVSDGTDVYFLAHAYRHEGVTQDWPDGYASQLFRFNTKSDEIERIPFPLLERRDFKFEFDFTQFDLAATGEALYLWYAGRSASGRILQSRDRGNSWQDLTLPDSLRGSVSLHTHTSTDDILVYMNGPEGRKLYLSSDAGNSWQVRDCPRPFRQYDGTPILQYLGNGEMLMQSEETSGVLLGDSSGIWHEQGYPPFAMISAMADLPDGTLFACSADGGIFRTVDLGISWVNIRPEMNAGWSNHFQYACTALGSEGLIAVNLHGNIVLTHDNGLTWEEPRYSRMLYGYGQFADDRHGWIYTRNPENRLSASIMITDDGCESLRPIPPYPLSRPMLRTASLWYAAQFGQPSSDSLLCRSEDGGETWELVLEASGKEVYDVALSRADSNMLCLSTSNGLLLSTDRGDSWDVILDQEWTRKESPQDVEFARDNTIWLIADRTDFDRIVRSDGSYNNWETVLELTAGQDTTTWGFRNLITLDDEGVYVVSKPRQPAGEKGSIVLWYSDDDGDSWQTWESKSAAYLSDAMDYPLVMRSGVLLSMYRNFSFRTPVVPMQISMSADGLLSDTYLLEHALTGNIDQANWQLTQAGEQTAYLITGMAIYRITLPEVTGVRSPKPPPLPLSIGTPYPHPVPGRTGTSTLFIQSDRSARVSMTVHDLSGRVVGHLFDGELGPEGRHVTWSTGTLAPGTYVLQLKSSAGVCRRKVVVRA